jgi:hypothetical protein
MKTRKILIRVLFGSLVLAAAVLMVRAVLNYTEGRRLTRALAGLKAKGVPLTVKDLIGTCPDGENGAVLWKAAEELCSFEGEDIKLLNEAYRSIGNGLPVPPDAWASVARLVEKNRRALAFIPEVAAKTCFRYGDLDVFAWERRMPNAIKMLRSVRLWGLDALMTAQKGDLAGSLDRLRTGLRFAPKNAEERTLITFLLALADAKTCLMFLNRSLCGREAGEDLLTPLLGDLDDRQIEHWKELLENGIRGEQVVYLEFGAQPGAAILQEEFFGKALASRLYVWLLRPLIKRDIRRTLPIYARLEELAHSPYHRTRQFWPSYHDHLRDLPWFAFLSKNLIPDLETTFMKLATFDALVLTARTGLACRIYKSRTGEYPDTLEALVPGLLKEVPVDPFTGKPLVYRREGEGFIVYSLGNNQKDDGGRSTWEITQLVMDKDDDWTWKEDR